MDFLATTEQLMLQEAVRELCAKRLAPHRLVEAFAATGEPAAARDVWVELADLGVFGLRRSPEDGGLGLGLAEAALVFEELGHGLVPGPLIATHLAATYLSDVDDVLSGRRLVGGIDGERRPFLVEHFGLIEDLVVQYPDRLELVERVGVTAVPIARSLDPLTPLHHAPSLPAGSVLSCPAAVWHAEAAILGAAYQVGIGQALLDRSVRFVRDRVQFGRPVGSFQAVQHMLADMLVRVELARSATLAAAVTSDEWSGQGKQDTVDGFGEPAALAAAAKLLADRAAVRNGTDAVQVHGGMGFTWELDVQLYLKRAWVLASVHGTVDEHAEALAARL